MIAHAEKLIRPKLLADSGDTAGTTRKSWRKTSGGLKVSIILVTQNIQRHDLELCRVICKETVFSVRESLGSGWRNYAFLLTTVSEFEIRLLQWGCVCLRRLESFEL